MVVGEVEMSYNLVCAAEVVAERLVVCDSREEDESLGIEVAWVAFREDRLRLVVTDGGEEKVLVLPYLEGFCPFAPFPCVQPPSSQDEALSRYCASGEVPR